MLEKLANLFNRVWRLILACLVAVFGRWSRRQPRWPILLKETLVSLWQRIKTKPLAGAGVLVLLCGFNAAGWYGYQWWRNRPQPVLIDLTVTKPWRTTFEKRISRME